MKKKAPKTENGPYFNHPLLRNIPFEPFLGTVHYSKKKMPSESEVNKLFSEYIMDSEKISFEQREFLESRPVDIKWSMYCDHIDNDSNSPSPEFIFKCLKICPNNEVLTALNKQILRYKISWLSRFFAINGHQVLLCFLSQYNKYKNPFISFDMSASEVVSGALCCLKSLLNSDIGKTTLTLFSEAVPFIASLIQGNVGNQMENSIEVLNEFLFCDKSDSKNTVLKIKKAIKTIEDLKINGWKLISQELKKKSNSNLEKCTLELINNMMSSLVENPKIRIYLIIDLCSNGYVEFLSSLDEKDVLISAIMNNLKENNNVLESLFSTNEVNPLSSNKIYSKLKEKIPKQCFKYFLISLFTILMKYPHEIQNVMTFLNNFFTIFRYYLANKQEDKMEIAISSASLLESPITFPLSFNTYNPTQIHKVLYQESGFLCESELTTINIENHARIVDSVDTLLKENENYKSMNEKYQKEIEKLKLQLEEKQNDFINVKENLESENKTLLDNNENYQKIISGLELRNNKLYEQTEEVRNNYEKKINDLTLELKNKNETISGLNAMNLELQFYKSKDIEQKDQDTNNQLKQELEILKIQNSKLELKIRKYKNMITDSNEEFRKLQEESSNASNQNQIDSLEKELNKYKLLVQEKENQNVELKNEIKQLSNLSDKNLQLQSQIKDMDNKNKEMNDKINELTVNLNEKDLAIKTLNEEQTENLNKIAILNSKEKSNQSKILDLTRLIDIQKAEKTNNDEIEKLHLLLNNLHEEKQNLSEINDELKTEILKYKSEIDDLNSRNLGLKGNIDILKSQNHELELKYENKNSECLMNLQNIELKENEIHEKQIIIEELQNNLKNNSDTFIKDKNEILNYKSQNELIKEELQNKIMLLRDNEESQKLYLSKIKNIYDFLFDDDLPNNDLENCLDLIKDKIISVIKTKDSDIDSLNKQLKTLSISKEEEINSLNEQIKFYIDKQQKADVEIDHIDCESLPYDQENNIAPKETLIKFKWNKLSNSYCKRSQFWIKVNNAKIELQKQLFETDYCFPSSLEKKVLDFISNAKMNGNDIIFAIKKCVKLPLNEQQIQELIDIFPTEEEIEYFSKIKRNDAQEFLYNLSNIPYIKLRLDLFKLNKGFKKEFIDIRYSLVELLKGIQEIQNSKQFIGLISLILKIGNYVNGGTELGGAYGFTLSSLSNLKDTPIPSFLIKNYQEFTNFIKSLDNFIKCENLDIYEIYNNIEKNFDVFNKSIDILDKKEIELDVNDFFYSFIDMFKKANFDYANETFNMAKDIINKYNELLKDFGEPEEKINEFIDKIIKLKNEFVLVEEKKSIGFFSSFF